jgi:hypothetical protein
MYKNKCSKCGTEFETKNPKRVICPSCLYPDRPAASLSPYTELNTNKPPEQEEPKSFQQPSENQQPYRRPFQQGDEFRKPFQQGSAPSQGDGFNRPQQGGFNRPQQGGFNRPPQGGFNRPNQGGFNRPPQGGFNRPNQGGFNRPPQGGFNRPNQGGFNRPQGGFNRPNQGGFSRPAIQKTLLVTREQVAEIERIYKTMLPLPNPDVHEIIAKEINLEPNKVFFGINLVRLKMKLPKLPFPKRKLAVSSDQLTAIESLYTPLLPLPPIGCHKFISKQLRMDEWRVHVGIGIIRKKLDIPRWNPDREDAPTEFRNAKATEAVETPED